MALIDSIETERLMQKRLAAANKQIPAGCPVSAAMAYGDGEYEGYWLEITLTSGEKLTGSFYTPKDGVVRMEQPGSDPVFIATAAVVTARVCDGS